MIPLVLGVLVALSLELIRLGIVDVEFVCPSQGYVVISDDRALNVLVSLVDKKLKLDNCSIFIGSGNCLDLLNDLDVDLPLQLFHQIINQVNLIGVSIID